MHENVWHQPKIYTFFVDVVGLFPMVFASATAIKSIHDVQDNMFLFRNERTHVEEEKKRVHRISPHFLFVYMIQRDVV